MHVLAILNQKGGVAKTTTAISLAHGAALRGRRVLIVDLDAQGSTAEALGLDKSPGLYRLLIDQDPDAAIVATGRENLDLVPGDKETVVAREMLAGRPFRETLLKRSLASLDYDLVVLDTAPGLDLLQVSALVAATHYLIPVALDHLAVAGAADALLSAAALADAGSLTARLLAILPTFYERRTNESRAQLAELAARFGSLVWPPIPSDVKAREAPAFGQTLWEYAPKSRAIVGVPINGGTTTAGGYAATLDRLLQEVHP